MIIALLNLLRCNFFFIITRFHVIQYTLHWYSLFSICDQNLWLAIYLIEGSFIPFIDSIKYYSFRQCYKLAICCNKIWIWSLKNAPCTSLGRLRYTFVAIDINISQLDPSLKHWVILMSQFCKCWTFHMLVYLNQNPAMFALLIYYLLCKQLLVKLLRGF